MQRPASEAESIHMADDLLGGVLGGDDESESIAPETLAGAEAFAARGVTGEAFAEGLASRMAAIRAFTNSRSITYSGEVRADQSGVLKVQIPETGITVDELEHFLHRWLGHQTVVNGQLVGGAGEQLSLVLHIGSADPISVSGSSTDLHGLVQTAAEKAFAVFDPVNDIIYLDAAGRRAEAYAAAQRHMQSSSLTAPSSLDQAVAYNITGAHGSGRTPRSRERTGRDRHRPT
jgi:hypothetical protein